MALDFIDSTSHSGAGASQIPVSRKWTGFSFCFYQNAAGGAPVRRVGQSVLQFTAGCSKTLAYKSARTFGCAYYLSSSNDHATGFMGMSSGGQQLVYLTIESDRSLSIYTSPSNVRIYNSGAQHLYITNDVYHYYELQVALGGGSPITVTVSVQVDGTVWASTITGNTGINASALFINAAEMNQVGIGAPIGGSNTGFATDVYVLNTDGTDVNGFATTLTTFLGDVSIVPTVPAADVSVAWSPFPAATSPTYPLVNEIPPDDDTTYVFSDTVSQVATYNFTPLSGFSGTIFGAQLLLYAKVDNEGTRSISGLVHGTVVNSLYGAQAYLYDYYDYFIFPLDSDLGSAWTQASFNAENFGILLAS